MPRREKSEIEKAKAYLTKRTLIRATGKATRSLSSEAMSIKGFVVKAEKGWVVRIHNTGVRERLCRLDHSSQVALD